MHTAGCECIHHLSHAQGLSIPMKCLAQSGTLRWAFCPSAGRETSGAQTCPLGRGKERTLRLVLGRGLVSGAGARIHDEGLLLIMLS